MERAAAFGFWLLAVPLVIAHTVWACRMADDPDRFFNIHTMCVDEMDGKDVIWFAYEDVFDDLCAALVKAYRQVKIGDPLEEGVLMGPLIDTEAVEAMQKALDELKSQGGRVLYGGEVLTGKGYESGAYVTPCLCEARYDMPIVSRETFAPILYLMKYKTLEEAIQWHNAVPQGLSSAIFFLTRKR